MNAIDTILNGALWVSGGIGWIIQLAGMAAVGTAPVWWIVKRRSVTRARREWRRGEAVVIDTAYERSEQPRGTVPLTVTYRFRDATGGEREASQSAPMGNGAAVPVAIAQRWVATFVPGRTVPVWYDPGPSGRSALLLEAPSFGSVVVLLFVGAVAILIGWGWRTAIALP